MAVTQLDPVSALLLIDLQRGVVALPTAHPIGAVLERAGRLAQAFRRHRLPVVLVKVVGSAPGRVEAAAGAGARADDFADIVTELDQQPGDHSIIKRTWGAFTNTELADLLAELRVTQVVIGGVATSMGVESTARHAHERGFHVTIVTDAITDTSIEAHDNSVKRVFPKIGETGTTDQVVALLDRLTTM